MSLELFILASAGSLLHSAITGGGSGDAGGGPNPLGDLVGTALGGIVGNRADDLAKLLAVRMGDDRLPVNHHVQRAGREALAATLEVLAEAVAANMAEAGGRPPLFEAIRRRLRDGTLTAQPLIEIRDFPEPRWLEAFLALAQDGDALKELHRRVSFDEATVLAALEDGAAAQELARRFGTELDGWLDERLGPLPGRPDCLADFLARGFPVEPDSPRRVLPFEAWRLFFAEKAKTSQEVFGILVLHALAQLTNRPEADFAGRAADFDTLLSGPLRAMQETLDRIEADIQAMRRTQAGHGETLAGIAAGTGRLEDSLAGLHDKADRLLERPAVPRGKPANLPYHSRGDLFRGREPALDELHAAFEAGAGAAAIGQRQAVHGLGGVGKTRLAVEYAHRHAEAYTARLFVEAPSPEALDSGLAGLAALLGLPEQDAPEQDARRDAVLRWLRASRGGGGGRPAGFPERRPCAHHQPAEPLEPGGPHPGPGRAGRGRRRSLPAGPRAPPPENSGRGRPRPRPGPGTGWPGPGPGSGRGLHRHPEAESRRLPGSMAEPAGHPPALVRRTVQPAPEPIPPQRRRHLAGKLRPTGRARPPAAAPPGLAGSGAHPGEPSGRAGAGLRLRPRKRPRRPGRPGGLQPCRPPG